MDQRELMLVLCCAAVVAMLLLLVVIVLAVSWRSTNRRFAQIEKHLGIGPAVSGTQPDILHRHLTLIFRCFVVITVASCVFGATAAFKVLAGDPSDVGQLAKILAGGSVFALGPTLLYRMYTKVLARIEVRGFRDSGVERPAENPIEPQPAQDRPQPEPSSATATRTRRRA